MSADQRDHQQQRQQLLLGRLDRLQAAFQEFGASFHAELAELRQLCLQQPEPVTAAVPPAAGASDRAAPPQLEQPAEASREHGAPRDEQRDEPAPAQTAAPDFEAAEDEEMEDAGAAVPEPAHGAALPELAPELDSNGWFFFKMHGEGGRATLEPRLRPARDRHPAAPLTPHRPVRSAPPGRRDRHRDGRGRDARCRGGRRVSLLLLPAGLQLPPPWLCCAEAPRHPPAAGAR